MKLKWIVGIDEAGRGPLAGPVSVGLVMVPTGFEWAIIPDVNDSKKLSEKKREQIYQATMQLAARGALFCTVELASSSAIDRNGIAVVIRELIAKGLTSLCNQANVSVSEVRVLLDGSLYAPAIYLNQETIIKGDAKEKVIGLASVLAKVTRDRYMSRISQKPKFVMYNFARHKGYGTIAHRRAIRQYGLSSEHRRSYCKNCTAG